MSAEFLREAAALMRANAEKAEPGRWKLWGMSVMADPKGTSNVDDCIYVADAYTPSTTDRRLHTGNADHIASWHPAVALAVADWLDRDADGWEQLQSVIDEPLPADSWSTAVAVAAAYLGRQP